MKKCKDCEIIKDIKEFSIKRSSKDGHQDRCKVCAKIYNKRWRKENKNKIKEYSKVYYDENKNIILENNKKYYAENKNIILENNKKYYKVYYKDNKNKINKRNKKYYEENKYRILENNKKYKEENKSKINKYSKNRILNDPLYKLKKNMRNLIYNSFRNGGYIKGSKSNDILGCSYEDLLHHLNDNEYGFIYGDVTLDIDHITPLSRATSEVEIIKLNHYSNLQLLPSEYNRYIKRDNDFSSECLEEWLESRNLI